MELDGIEYGDIFHGVITGEGDKGDLAISNEELGIIAFDRTEKLGDNYEVGDRVKIRHLAFSDAGNAQFARVIETVEKGRETWEESKKPFPELDGREFNELTTKSEMVRWVANQFDIPRHLINGSADQNNHHFSKEAIRRIAVKLVQEGKMPS